ncbi:cupin domain-containing protein [Clostridium sp. D2Q-14]|nr:cupin domain-containing protein [Anaeromonas gelatinilytica]MBS4536349.1 cupin domain-containing protein [Anaeromonas gelatinilytica]
MIVSHEKNVKTIKFNNSEVKNAIMKALISPKEGWDGHVMRVMEVGKEGYTPKHSHPWPHINYILEGKGILHIDGEDNEVKAGSFAYVPADKIHQFKNIGEDRFKFICIVPEEGHK